MAFGPRTRARMSGRRKRNSAWSGILATRRTVAPGATDTLTVCDSSAQLAVGLSPTLVRLRGAVGVDPDISPSATGPQFWTVYAMIYVGPTALSINGTGLGNEGVLWADIINMSSANRAIIAGADSEMLGQYTINHERVIIDSKAKRRLEEPGNTILMSVLNGSASASNIQWSFFLRCLVVSP